MSRNQWTLAGILLLQLVLIVVLRSPFAGNAYATTPELLLPTLGAITPTRVELDAGKEEQDQQPVVLARDGETWKVESLDGFPADKNKVDGLLVTLGRLRVTRPLVSSSRYHEAFKVETDANEGRVRLWSGPGEDPAVDLIVGDSPNYRVTHVRRAGEDPVYEVRGLASFDVRARNSDWADKDLVQPESYQVVGLRLTNPSGTFEIEKEGDAWKVRAPESAAGTTLAGDKVDELLRAATSLHLADAVGAKQAEAQGLARPAATLTLRWTADGTSAAAGESAAETQETTVLVGGAVADNESQRYVSRADFGFTGTVWESSIKRLLEGRVDELTAS